MGAGASSTPSKRQSDAPAGETSLFTRIAVSSAAQTSKHARRIQELEDQVRDLMARVSVDTGGASVDSFIVPHVPFQYPAEFNFSEESIAIRAPSLPPLDRSLLSAEQAAVAEHLQKEYQEAEAEAQDFMRTLKNTIIRTMRKCWVKWNHLPILAGDFKTTSLLTSQIDTPQNALPEPFTLAQSPTATCVQQHSNASTSDSAMFQILANASLSTLNLRDKQFMGKVFDRHARPVGLSAKALVSALSALHPSVFSAEISEADAAKKLKEVDTKNKGYCIFEDFFETTKKVGSHEVTKESAARAVFQQKADVKGMSAQQLVNALREVDAPLLLCSERRSPEQIFRLADANASGSVDLIEFMRVAQLPDDLEMILDNHNLGCFAPALRAYFKIEVYTYGDDQVKHFAQLQKKDVFAAVEASIQSLKQQLESVHSLVKTATDKKDQLKEALVKDPNSKFSTFKAAGGTIDDFFDGLEDRIGAPNLDFTKAMCAEHTTRGGSTFTFTTGNYNITTQPFKEWSYVVKDENGQRVKCPNMDHNRQIIPIDELMKKPLAITAGLKEAEMIAVVLYTGGFQYDCPLFMYF
jgi:hypothetical protein